jgi:hypothetical protein
MTIEEKLALIQELRECDHCFISTDAVKMFTTPFGFEGTTFKARDTRKQPKGLTLNDGAKWAVGQDAAIVAEQIMRHLGLKSENEYATGRGFRLRYACNAIEEHLKQQLAKDTAK